MIGKFFRVSDKQLVDIRNNVFVERCIPALNSNGFQKSPFSTAWYGKDDNGGYSYELCRVSKDLNLEIIFVYIVKGDRWIQVFLNIYDLQPKLQSIDELNSVDGLQYHLNPNRLKNMRLRIDDYKGIPLFRTKEYRLKSFSSRKSLEKRIKELGDLIEKDCSNIDYFVKRWHEMYTPNITDWEGNVIKNIINNK